MMKRRTKKTEGKKVNPTAMINVIAEGKGSPYWEPVACMVRQGKYADLEHELSQGIPSNTTDLLTGETLMILAAKYDQKRICKLLRDWGADINAKDLLGH